jgi:hypothetical protein
VLASGRYDRIRRSWTDKARFVEDAQADVSRLEAMAAAGPGDPAETPGLPARLHAVNHQPWSWNGLLRLGRADGPVRITNEPAGTELPAVVIDGEAWVRVAGLPPLSQTTLRIEADESADRAPAEESACGGRPRGRAGGRRPRRLALDNARLRVEVDPAAGMTALIDRATGRNWAARRGRLPFGAYRYDVFSRREIVDYLRSYAYDLESWFLDDFGKPGYPERDHSTFFGRLADARIESAPGWQRIRLLWSQDGTSARDLGNAETVNQRIVLYDDLPWMDMDIVLEGKKECPLLEAGHVVFALDAERPRYSISRTGSVVDPAVDIAVDANRLLHCCDRWVDVADGGSGLLVIPFDSPLFSIGSIAIERFDGAALPVGAPVLNFNLFNTQWGTNFPQWIGGSFRFSFRIIPHRGDWREARAWEHASAALQPPVCLPAGGDTVRSPGLLARQVRGLQTVVIKHAEAGDGVIWRFQEAAGRKRKQTLHFRCPGQTAPIIVRCSLLEDEVEVLRAVRAGDSIAVELSVRPFEILTLKLKSAASGRSAGSFPLTPRPG